jgi:DNA-binding response OmpR family regulator
LRRAQTPSTAMTCTLGRATFYLDKHEVETADGSREVLTPKEVKLLKSLLKNADRVTSRDELLSAAWNDDESPSPRTIDNFIVKLRRWVEADPSSPQHVVSHRGVGYSLKSVKEGKNK